MSEATTAHQALTKGDGYFLLENLISTEAAAKLRSIVLAKLSEGTEMAKGDINLPNLLAHGSEFEQIITNPRLLAVAHSLLGPDAKLAAFTAKTLMPGGDAGRLHIDYPYWAMDTGMPVEPALMMQVIWMMNPFNTDNGGTWILPGSQKFAEHVNKEKFESEAIQAIGNAGDAIVSHGQLWHQTAVNRSDEPRVAILINFSQLAIRPLSELGPFSNAFLDRASPELLNLLPVNFREALMARLKRNYS